MNIYQGRSFSYPTSPPVVIYALLKQLITLKLSSRQSGFPYLPSPPFPRSLFHSFSVKKSWKLIHLKFTSQGISFGSFTCIILVPVGTLLSCLWLELIWFGCQGNSRVSSSYFILYNSIPHSATLQSMLIMVERVSWMHLFIARYYHSNGRHLQAQCMFSLVYTSWVFLVSI